MSRPYRFNHMKPYAISILVNTLLLLVLSILTSLGKCIPLCFLIFTISPLSILIMVYLILTDKGYQGRELKQGEEWGYQDKAL